MLVDGVRSTLSRTVREQVFSNLNIDWIDIYIVELLIILGVLHVWWW